MAAALTAACLMVLFAAVEMKTPASTAIGGEAPRVEALAYVTIVPVSPHVAPPQSSRTTDARRPPVAGRVDAILPAGIPDHAAVDSGSTPRVSSRPDAPVFGNRSARLIPPPRQRGAGGWGPVSTFDPFAERAPPSPAVRDSLLRALHDTMPFMARTRVATHAERDVVAKERMLTRQLTGRVLLDPPAPGNGTYSGRGGGITVPLFSPGISRAVRVRDSVAFAENLPRLERLRLRADSLRRARARDSVTMPVVP